jgi:hypothetical protein
MVCWSDQVTCRATAVEYAAANAVVAVVAAGAQHHPRVTSILVLTVTGERLDSTIKRFSDLASPLLDR